MTPAELLRAAELLLIARNCLYDVKDVEAGVCHELAGKLRACAAQAEALVCERDSASSVASSSSRGGTSPEVEEALKRLDWLWEKLQRMGEDASDLAWKRDMAWGTGTVAMAIRLLRASTTTAEATEELIHEVANAIWHSAPTLQHAKEQARSIVERYAAPAPHVARTEKAKFCHHGDGCSESWHVGGNYGSPVCKNPAHHVAPPEALGGWTNDKVANAVKELREAASAPAPAAHVDDWVACPICRQPDMRSTVDAENNRLIFCTNHACRSNGGAYDAAMRASAPAPTKESAAAGCATLPDSAASTETGR